MAPQTRNGICYSTPGIFLHLAREFSVISQKKGTIWSRLATGLVYAKTVIHLSVGE